MRNLKHFNSQIQQCLRIAGNVHIKGVRDLKELHVCNFCKNKQISLIENYVILKSAISTTHSKSLLKKFGAIFEKIAFERFWKCGNFS